MTLAERRRDPGLRAQREPLWRWLRLGATNGTPEKGKNKPLPFSVTDIFDETSFSKMLCLERKRTERSGRRFVLMLLECHANPGGRSSPLEPILLALSTSTRETDIKGWYAGARTIGVIFTEIGPAEGRLVANALLMRINEALRANLDIEDLANIHMSFHVFPEDWGQQDPGTSTLYPDLAEAQSEPVSIEECKFAADSRGRV